MILQRDVEFRIWIGKASVDLLPSGEDYAEGEYVQEKHCILQVLIMLEGLQAFVSSRVFCWIASFFGHPFLTDDGIRRSASCVKDKALAKLSIFGEDGLVKSVMV